MGNADLTRQYMDYFECANDGHGRDITRKLLPLMNFEQWRRSTEHLNNREEDLPCNVTQR